jgi:ribonuclease VapC
MIIDSSALIAVIYGEDDAPEFLRVLSSPFEIKKISAANYLEAAIVIDGSRNPIVSRGLDELVAKSKISIMAVTPEHAMIARAAYRDFGKGNGHPARLNFGDCFAYALAKSEREPLQFKGDGFQHTDVAEYGR